VVPSLVLNEDQHRASTRAANPVCAMRRCVDRLRVQQASRIQVESKGRGARPKARDTQRRGEGNRVVTDKRLPRCALDSRHLHCADK